MNKKAVTRLAVLTTAILLIFAGFAGCTKDAKTAEPQENTQSQGSQEESTTDESAQESADNSKADEMYVVGITQIVDHPSLNVCRDGAVDKLSELGFIDGENLTLIYENAQGEMSIATTIAQQFVSDKVDVILAIATPTAQAAYAAAIDTDVSIAFSAISAPVESELVNQDGSNLKGVTGTSDELPMEATFKLIQSLAPDTVKVGILHNTSEVNSDVQLAQAQKLAPNFGMEIVDIGITSTNEIASAIDTLLPQVDVVMNLTDNMVVSAMPLLVQKCNEALVPLFGSEDTQVAAGALASAGVDYYALGQKTGEMIASILNGTPAEELPIAKITEPMLIVNSDQAELLGINVPDSLTIEYIETATAE